MNTRKASLSLVALVALGIAAAGCAPRTTTMAPPVSQPMPPVAQAGMADAGQVYQWQDVPPNQEVPINRAVFDQGGYQLIAASGETIVVPFANQNMYVMKFGKSNTGGMYFVNENNQAPTLYVPNGGFLENAAASGAKWYPFPQNFNYTRPVYMGLAPTWNDYTNMGWYPGMAYYGGYWGYNPWHSGLVYAAMPGLYINIGGRPYYGWNSYRNYYTSYSTGRVGWSNYRSYNYSSVGRRANTTGSFGRSAGSTGSFGRGSSTAGSFGRSTTGSSGSFGSGRTTGSGSFGRSTGSSGSFGSGRTTAPGPSGSSSFGRSTTGSGSFGSGSSGSSFGTARNSPSTGSSSTGRSTGSGSFGSGSSGFGSSSGSRSSFGSGSSGFGSSSGSFGRSSGSTSSGSSFGRSSSGSSSSFGRSSSSGGSRSSFGGGRRR